MAEPRLRRLYRHLFKPGPLRRMQAGDRALPDFLVVGAMRAGTSSLHDLVCRHARVAPAIKKEVHFFDLAYARAEPWYRAHFPLEKPLRSQGMITGESTPYYLFHPLAHRRAAQVVPDARIIVILRHPVERAYSHYWHIVRLGAEPLSFEEALAREADRMRGETARIRQDPGYASRPHQYFSYKSRSVYVDQLLRWLEAYPRENVLILEHRRFFDDPERGLQRLFHFLGLDPQPVPQPVKINEAAYPPMAPATRRKLLGAFQDHNERLFNLLGETFDWQD